MAEIVTNGSAITEDIFIDDEGLCEYEIYGIEDYR
jgi:hypothetical protein